MDKIENVTVEDCASSNYIKPQRIHYTQNGKKKIWDAIKVHDSVAVLIYNSSKDVLLFVRQFRPAVYISCAEMKEVGDKKVIDSKKYPGSLGMTYELCAGIMDKDIPPVETAREEILEECGYDVPVEKIKKITGFRTNIGTSGAWMNLFYAEVTDDMKVSDGGGNVHEGEMIDVIEYPACDGRAFIMDEKINKPVAMMFGLQWFYDNVYDKGTKRKLDG